MSEPALTVAALRAAVTRMIRGGQLADPQSVRVLEPHLTLDFDDHVSDETLGGGRLRVVLRSASELYALARALDEAAAEVERRRMG
jgi:hypothetical protein